MVIPIKVWFEPDTVSRPFVGKLQKAGEAVFKFVGWCLVLGVVQYGYDRTKDWRLGVLTAILYLLLFLPYYFLLRWTLTSVRVQATLRSSRLNTAICVLIPAALVFFLMYVGLNVVESTITMIATLGGHK